MNLIIIIFIKLINYLDNTINNKYRTNCKRKYEYFKNINIIIIRFAMINIVIILTTKTTALSVLF